jgi:hypothetical protein
MDGDLRFARASFRVFTSCDRWMAMPPGLVWLAVGEDVISVTWIIDAEMQK